MPARTSRLPSRIAMLTVSSEAIGYESPAAIGRIQALWGNEKPRLWYSTSYQQAFAPQMTDLTYRYWTERTVVEYQPREIAPRRAVCDDLRALLCRCLGTSP